MNNAIVGLILAMLLLVILIIRSKTHPVIAMIAAASIIGLSANLGANKTLELIVKGFGSTLGSIGLIIGLGVMMGRILEYSGAAQQIANGAIHWLGEKRERWALLFTGFIVSIPIFADSAFVILFPIVHALAVKNQKSIVSLGVLLAGGLVLTHSLVPPTPGPLAVAGIFDIDLGTMILIGICFALPLAFVVYAYSLWLEKYGPQIVVEPKKGFDHQKSPFLLKSLSPILAPIVLICLKSILPWLGVSNFWFLEIINFVGHPIIALCISTLIAVYLLTPEMSKAGTEKLLEEGLSTAGSILLVTGAGGALGYMVRESGQGQFLAQVIAALPISAVMIPYLVSSVIRLIQGSGTVAMLTSASITAPILVNIPEANLALAAMGAALGSFLFSYFNDSLFWVVNKMLKVNHIKKQLLTWSMPTSILWAFGGIELAAANYFWECQFHMLDIIIPCTVLIGLMIYLRLVKTD